MEAGDSGHACGSARAGGESQHGAETKSIQEHTAPLCQGCNAPWVVRCGAPHHAMAWSLHHSWDQAVAGACTLLHFRH